VAARAQAENVQAPEFWHGIAERMRTVRDILSAGDIAVLLDALVSADLRHTDLMTLLAREILDDADKLSIVEASM
jgi:hypothetical protein